MSGLSLWLSPPSSSPLSTLPKTLSKRYETVSFEAHATLVSDEIVPAGMSTEEVLQRVREGVKSWKDGGEAAGEGLEMVFEDLRMGSKFYQCVLLTLHLSPSLLSLHESLLRSFSLSPPSPPTYFPHLSLIYGDLTPAQKENIIKELKSDDGMVRDVKGGVEVSGQRGFRSGEIRLVRTGGKTDEWFELGRVKL